MHALSKISPVTKAIAVIGSVMVLATSVTFAALQNTATLTGNTISSTSAGLQVDSDGDGSFGSTDEGFTFSGIEPGTKSEAMMFKLKNNTDETQDVYVQVTGESPLPSGVDPSDIKFIFDVPDGPNVKATWDEIIQTDGVLMLSDLEANDEADVSVKVKIDDSVTEDVSIAPFNFTFGTLEDAMTTSQAQ